MTSQSLAARGSSRLRRTRVQSRSVSRCASSTTTIRAGAAASSANRSAQSRSDPAIVSAASRVVVETPPAASAMRVVRPDPGSPETARLGRTAARSRPGGGSAAVGTGCTRNSAPPATPWTAVPVTSTNVPAPRSSVRTTVPSVAVAGSRVRSTSGPVDPRWSEKRRFISTVSASSTATGVDLRRVASA
ncbi:hypothetical protein HX744_11115 [Pseudonocardia sp. ICBG1122]|nr:hypothetical protein [Pseudonocardia pini]